LFVVRGGSVFLRWPEGARAIVDELVERRLPGIPRASRTLLDCLSSAGVLEARADGDWLWALEESGSDGWAVKFRDARVLLPADTAMARPSGADGPIRPREHETDTAGMTTDVEDACFDRWRKAWAAEPGCDVLAFEDGRIAVSHRLASASHPEPALLVESLRERGWLADRDSAGRGSRVGFVRFRDGQRSALILTAQAARFLRVGF
jgi:hypothetical protein